MKLIMLISTIVSHFYEQYCPPGDDLVSQKYIIQNKKNVHFIRKRARVDGMGIILRRIIMGKIDVLPIIC